MTGDEWLLGLRFRVPRHTFDEETLAKALDLPDVDDLDDVPVYGRQPRVRVKNANPPWQEVIISLLKPADIDTPAFKRLLKDAIKAYLSSTQSAKLDLEDHTPWKKLGRKWHVMRKGFLQGKVVWDAGVLEALFALLEDVWPDAKVDWGNKVLVNYKRGDERLATVVTKRPAGVDLELLVPAGLVPLGHVADLGSERDVLTKERVDIVHIRFTNVEQLKSPKLRTLLAER
jgi:excinuclease ABC subunit A